MEDPCCRAFTHQKTSILKMSYPSTTLGYFLEVAMCLKRPRDHMKTKQNKI